MQEDLKGCYERKWFVLLKVETEKREWIREVLETSEPTLLGDGKRGVKDDSWVGFWFVQPGWVNVGAFGWDRRGPNCC